MCETRDTSERRSLLRSEPPLESSQRMACPRLGILQDTYVSIYLLIILFSMSSWIEINGLWTELPILVNSLPEGWNLPSYLAVIIQVANIGPLLYTIGNRLAPSRIVEWPVIFLVLFIGGLSCVLLAVFWNRTSHINGAEHSTSLFALAAMLALVDCTSSVVYLPYMAVFKRQYMSAYYIGEGFSGMVPGVLGLIQGSGSNPVCVNETEVHTHPSEMNKTSWSLIAKYQPPMFSVSAFFFMLFALFVISSLAFTILHCCAFVKHFGYASRYVQQQCAPTKEDTDTTQIDSLIHQITNEGASTSNQLTAGDHTENRHNKIPETVEAVVILRSEQARPVLSKFSYFLLLFTVIWLNALSNGVLPSIQTYSALPYGNLAYNLVIRISMFANPIACMFALLVSTSSSSVITVLSMCSTLCAAYQILLAALSPTPPMQEEWFGILLVVVTSVVFTALTSYVKVSIATVLRDHGGHTALLYCGLCTQLGSLLGAIIAFIIVNILHLLIPASVCGR